jgi:hypothetical protein
MYVALVFGFVQLEGSGPRIISSVASDFTLHQFTRTIRTTIQGIVINNIFLLVLTLWYLNRL